MKKSKKGSRRQFLKNTSLVALSLGVLPNFSKAKPVPDDTDVLACDISTEDAYGQGPFYSENAPIIENDLLATATEVGTRLIISGQIRNLDCTEVLPNTEIDIWHADDAGDYDNVGYNLRGKTTSNSEGFYVFETIKPGRYLNGSDYRPSHIHFKITPPDSDPLITQLYFEDDPYIADDFAASKTSGVYDATHRIIPLTTNTDGNFEGTWDIVIEGNEPIIDSISNDKGMIYNVSPNPFRDRLEINYGVFQKAKVSLFVYDLKGNMVANLDEQVMNPQKYSVVWEPDSNLSGGHYFIALKVNELQVHYLKVIRGK